MDVVGAKRNGLLPVVVDDELAAMAGAHIEAGTDFATDARRRGVLEAELDGLDAEGHEPLEPGEVRDDRVEDVDAVGADRHHFRSHHFRLKSKNGVPATGVDGAAMSRTSISPAS